MLTLVCSKRGLDPSIHRLRRPQSRSPLDQALSIRLANLSNRSKLELYQLSDEEKKRERWQESKMPVRCLC